MPNTDLAPWNVLLDWAVTLSGVIFMAFVVMMASRTARTLPPRRRRALTTTRAAARNFDLMLRMKTVRQLRTLKPNAWETAWVMWHYTDGTHFYCFTLKTNGWELGKGAPAYPGGQRFLATGPTPRVALGAFQPVRVRQMGAQITVSVGGRRVVSFTDRERPYLAGKFGLYTEDAQVEFNDLRVAY